MASQTEDPTHEIQTKYDDFQKACKAILPKIDRKLIEDFLYRQQEDPGTRPMYSIEVTTKEGLDTQKIKDLVWSKIGEIPDIDNHGTYYRIEHILTLEALRRLSDHDFVLSVKGSYTGPYSF
jgi:hypothetical protein